MAFRGSSRKVNGFGGKKIGNGFGKKSKGGSAFGSALNAMGSFTEANRYKPVPQPKMSNFTSSLSTKPKHLRKHYNSNTNTAANIVGNVSRSLISNNSHCCNHNSFGNAMGNALGGYIGSAIVMAVGSKIQEKQQEYVDKKEAEALAAQQAAAAAEQAKREAAFHAMNKNMPNYDEETMKHLMDGAGLTEEEKENYPLQCPYCLGVPDGTRYCPYCGGKLV